MQRPDRARWVAALLQGMRQGEVLGLTWECVDLDGALIDVSWQLQALPYVKPYDRTSGFRVPDGYEHRQLVGAWHLVRPKTARGQRIIPLVPWMADELRAWRTVAPKNPWGLVWSTGDKPVDPKDDTDAWVSIQEAAGVEHPHGRPWYGHETRHATVTMLAELDVPTYVIEAIVGHATLVKSYLHANQEATRKALERMADRLGLGETPAIES
jgi:integrase